MPRRERVEIEIRGIENISPAIERIKAKMDELRKKMAEYAMKMQQTQNRAWKSRYYNMIRQLSKEYATLDREVRQIEKPFRDYEKQIAKTEQRSGRFGRVLTNLRSTFRRLAADFVWASLSMLGVSWSFRAVIDSTLTPLQQYVDALSQYERAAFGVATWLAIAKRQGIDVSELLGGRSIEEVAKDVTDTAMLLKATFGSLQEMFLLFISNVIEKTPGLKEQIVSTFEAIAKVLSDERVVKAMGDFISGVLTGISTIIDKLPDLIKFFDELFSTIFDSVAVVSKTLFGFVPGVTEISDRVLEAESGFEKLGIAVGGLAAILPLLTPLLTFFQALFSVVQMVFFGIYGILKALGLFSGKEAVFGNIGKKGGGNFATKFASAASKIKDKITSFIFKGAVSGFKKFIEAISKDKVVMSKIISFFETAINKLSTSKTVINALGTMFRKAFVAGILGGLAGIRAKLTGAKEAAATTLTNLFKQPVPPTIPVLFPFVTPFLSALEKIVSWGGFQIGAGNQYNTVNVNQYVNIGQVNSESDVDKIKEELIKEFKYLYASIG